MGVHTPGPRLTAPEPDRRITWNAVCWALRTSRISTKTHDHDGRCAELSDRPLSLGDLRAAVLRDDDQLHRPPDPGAAEADPRRGAEVVERAVRPREHLVPGLVR